MPKKKLPDGVKQPESEVADEPKETKRRKGARKTGQQKRSNEVVHDAPAESDVSKGEAQATQDPAGPLEALTQLSEHLHQFIAKACTYEDIETKDGIGIISPGPEWTVSLFVLRSNSSDSDQ